jgi:hypothetical protein
VPLSVTVQIKKFLGTAGFCQIWIPSYSVLAKPVYKATKWGEWEPMVWEEEQKRPVKQFRGHSQMPLLWACQL